MIDAYKQWLLDRGLSADIASLVYVATAATAVILLCVIANYLAKQVILRIVTRLIKRSETTWDDAFLKRKVFTRLSHLAPVIVLHATAPAAFGDYPAVVDLVRTGSVIYMVIVGLLVLDAFLAAGLDIYNRFPISRRFPLKIFVQVVKIVVFSLGGIYVIASLIGKSPLVLFSGLGAFTAVLILVFKDTILGLVAGIQIISNQLIRKGDWIEMPKFGVDGDVVDVSLMSVSVQNWDKTIATVPTYAIISDSFRNWRGMSESGGRRIKRAIRIDMNSVRFVDDEQLARFDRIQALREYLAAKREELAAWNREHDVDETSLVNGRRLTNLGTFRAYLVEYLKRHPKISKDMTFLVRHLSPTSEGLPIEIYVFSNDQVWANYEGIQADIFDHVLAVLPLFDLRVFQAPSGADVRAIAPAVPA